MVADHQGYSPNWEVVPLGHHWLGSTNAALCPSGTWSGISAQQYVRNLWKAMAHLQVRFTMGKWCATWVSTGRTGGVRPIGKHI